MLGYSSNVLYLWESSRRAPTLGEFHRLALRSQRDVIAIWSSFFRVEPTAFDELDVSSAEFSAAVLRQLRGGRTIVEWSKSAGVSRFALSRWLRGEGQPRLPVALRLIDVATRRLIDWVLALTGGRGVPALDEELTVLARRRQMAVKQPWSQALLRAIELHGYRSLPGHRRGWLAAKVGIDLETEEQCLDALLDAGLVSWTGTRYVSVPETVDLAPLPYASRKRVKEHWSRVGLRRIANSTLDDGDYYSFNVFNVSHRDYQRLRELHVRYFEEMRAIVGASEPAETVAVVNAQLFQLGPNASQH